jgi:hypothetical protein
MTLSDNTIQRLKSSVLFLFHGFKTAMATLLALFVHQACPGPSGVCTLQDNVTDLTNFNTVVVAFNFATLVVFMVFYMFEAYKENWSISNLDVDATLPNTHLQRELMTYPVLGARLMRLNQHYCRYAIVLMVMNAANIALSSVLMSQYYGGYKTLTSLLTNVFLVADKLCTCLHMSLLSMRLTLPYSAYMSDHVVFNTLDKKHKRAPPEI